MDKGLGLFFIISETEKEKDRVALMTAQSIPGCHWDKELDIEQW